ncbi:RDD family protein [Lacinutrix salivirga]
MTTENFKVTTDLYASKGQRFANLAVDYALRLGLGFLIGLLIGLYIEYTGDVELYNTYFEGNSTLTEYVFGIIIILIYYVTFETIFSKSVGKFITKTVVIMEDGSKPNFADIFIRSLCRIIPFNAFSFLGAEGRGWHDSISNTYVVDEIRYNKKRATENSLEQIGKPLEF